MQDDTREYKKFVRAVHKDGNVVRDKAMADNGKPFEGCLSSPPRWSRQALRLQPKLAGTTCL